MINTFWLALGYACNNRCGHCYALGSNHLKGWMNVRYAKEVMESMKDEAESCLLIGGEPTLYLNLAEIISFGKSLGFKMIIVSNGRKFKDCNFTEGIFNSGLDRAVISLEGHNETTHNAITRCKSFSETISGIRECAKFGTVNTLTTICRANKDVVFETILLSYELGAKKAALNCATPVIGDSELTTCYCLNPIELAAVVNKTFRQAVEQNMEFQLNATFPLCLLDKDILLEAFARKWISIGCHMYRGKGVVFDWQGNILPCTHFSEHPLFTDTMSADGSFLLKNSFLQTWGDSKSEAGMFRNRLWRYPAEKCKNCQYWGGCIGGCPLFWLSFNPLVCIDQQEGR